MPKRASGLSDVAWITNEGRNGYDAAQNIPEDMSQESVNVSLKAGTLGTKRKTIKEVIFSPFDVGPSRIVGVNALFKFAPGQSFSGTQLVIMDNSSPVRMYASIAPPISNRQLVLTDAVTVVASLGAPWMSSAAALNRKLYIAYQSGVNRLHVLDIKNGGISTTALRRSGLKASAVPTVANQGGGATLPAIPRWYATCNRVKSGSTVILQSNLTAGVAFTPSGAGDFARVTKAAATGENETHWVLWGSVVSADGPFYPIAETAVATTFYDDAQDPNTYSANGDAAPPFGSHYPMPSVKSIVSDGARLVGFGVWESAAGDSVLPQNGTIYFSPVLAASFGSGSGQDDERFQATADQVDTLVLSLDADSIDVGLSPVLNNKIYAFQRRGIWALTPTQNSQVPYAKHQIDKHRGAMTMQSIILGADAQGQPCIYFLNPDDGPNRIGIGGTIEWLGKDIADIWPTVNQYAGFQVSHGVYDSNAKEVRWFVALTVANDDPSAIIVFNVTLGRTEVRGQGVRYGWSKWDGMIATSRASIMLEPFPDADVLPPVEIMYVGRITTPYIARQSGVYTSDDNSSSFQAYVRSGALWGFAARAFRRLFDAYLSARALAATTIRQTITRNNGQDNPTADVSIAAAGTETRVLRRVGDTNVAECNIAQVQLGDSAAAATGSWQLDRWDACTEETVLEQPNP
jgi:hypothetical protein